MRATPGRAAGIAAVAMIVVAGGIVLAGDGSSFAEPAGEEAGGFAVRMNVIGGDTSHAGPIGMPPKLTVRFDEDNIGSVGTILAYDTFFEFTVDAWVPIIASLTPDLLDDDLIHITGMGTGTVATNPNIKVTFEGTARTDEEEPEFTGIYTMGVNGGLPGGDAIVYGIKPNPESTRTVSVSSATIAPNEQAVVDVVVSDIAEPGLGAWTIDISYDSGILTVEDCEATSGTCQDLGDSVRFEASDAGGLLGDVTIGTVRFGVTDVPGETILQPVVHTLLDANSNDISLGLAVSPGTITVGGGGTPVPTSTPVPTNTPPPGNVYIVNTTVDEPDAMLSNPACEIAPPGSDLCSLRGAIEQANTEGGATIMFDPIVFPPGPGKPSIPLDATGQGELPPIEVPLTIDATDVGVIIEPADDALLDYGLFVLDGNSADPTEFTILGGNLELRGFQNTDASAVALGDGIVICGDSGLGCGSGPLSDITFDGISTNDNAGTGIFLGSSGTSNVTIDGVTSSGNGISGIEITNVSGPVNGLRITNSTIAGNGNDGVFIRCIDACPSTNSSIDFTSIDSNGGDGIFLDSVTGSFTVNGTSITNSTGVGINITETSLGIRLTEVSTGSNGGLGIDLNGDGVTLNDLSDGDSGANGLLNFPENMQIDLDLGTITGQTCASCRVELYLTDDPPDPSGYGEGLTFIVGIVADGSGSFTLPIGDAPCALHAGSITATATDAAGNTSEFSLNVAGFPGTDPCPTPTPTATDTPPATDTPLPTSTATDTPVPTQAPTGSIFLITSIDGESHPEKAGDPVPGFQVNLYRDAGCLPENLIASGTTGEDGAVEISGQPGGDYSASRKARSGWNDGEGSCFDEFGHIVMGDITGTNVNFPVSPDRNGDVNKDGATNSIDAALVLQAEVGDFDLVNLGVFNAQRADVNQDGAINSIDAAVILQFVIGRVPSLPVGG